MRLWLKRSAGLFYVLLTLVMPVSPAAAQTHAPAQVDPYAALIYEAEQGNETVDFHALRLTYLSSPARINARFSFTLPKLEQTLREQLVSGTPAQIQDTALKILAIDYVDLGAQKALREACKSLHETACEKRRHFVEFGLLKSIMGTGDGKSCEKSWEAIIPGEEQAVLDMLNVTLDNQVRATAGSHSCDEMHVTSHEGRKLVYYFNVDAMLADQAQSRIAPAPQR